MLVGAVASLVVAAGPSSALPEATAPASVYVIQGVAGSTASVSVDGSVVDAHAAAKKIIGPLRLAPGSHTVTVKLSGAAQGVTSTVKVARGTNLDVVVHRQVDPAAAPVITTYQNDLAAVAHGSGRLAVAHVAAVGPADVRVNRKVLFANIASGEVLTLTVPAGTYPVDIVPTATTGPVVLGPVDLPVAPDALTRVFAIGVASQGTMDAIVQVLPLPARGNGVTPARVESGNGGQAVSLIEQAHARDAGTSQVTTLATTGALGLLVVLFGIGVRRRRQRGASTTG